MSVDHSKQLVDWGNWMFWYGIGVFVGAVSGWRTWTLTVAITGILAGVAIQIAQSLRRRSAFARASAYRTLW